MTKPIPEAELMLSLPIDDWEWLTDWLSAGLESCTHPYVKRHRQVHDKLCVQFHRQKAALKPSTASGTAAAKRPFQECPRCQGSRRFLGNHCPHCEGTGFYPVQRCVFVNGGKGTPATLPYDFEGDE